MICVTGLETTAATLAERLARNSRHRQEVRLDALSSIDDSLWSMLAGYPLLILTCRGRAEGGLFRGGQKRQLEILHKALSVGVDYVDVEASLGLETIRELYIHRGRTQLIVSSHEFKPGVDPAQLWNRLTALPADLHKLAYAVEDTSQLEPLLDLPPAQTGKRVLIGMGAAGLLTRALPAKFGSAWSYVHDSEEVAPGQLAVKTALEWGVGSAQKPMGLLGGESVLQSPGPRVYNRLFREKGIEAIYLPLLTHNPEAALRLARRLGFIGLSVTMPAKTSLLPQLSEMSAAAQKAGAVNTIRIENSKLSGENTDALAFRKWLGDFTGSLLVLGAGGVARAALAVAGRAKITVAARKRASADALANEFGGESIPWDERSKHPAEVILNATPLGSDGKSSPLANGVRLKGRTVIDSVMLPGGTPLVRKAQRAGAVVRDGYDLWCEQGALQMQTLLGAQFTSDDLREALDD